MKYLLIDFEKEEFWVEVGTEGYACRQVIVNEDETTHVSCFEDCLAEGAIHIDELDGEFRFITQHEFEKKWNTATLNKRKLWEVQKEKYPIGKEVRLKVAYHYPQGWILREADLIGIYSGKVNLRFNQRIKGTVIGYDESNMWIRISDINKEKENDFISN
ncbi:hypothetical protein [Pseudalkalibacillus sp. SCS-8]|uniref:hypothetical protein n=1 Tax=Pseudalkalibacillus nanhaiensis TaxID=3115291 RepID=UPI0032DAFAF2